MTNTTNTLTLKQVAKALNIHPNTKADRMFRLDHAEWVSGVAGTHVDRAIRAMKYVRETGRLSGDMEIKLCAMSPYQVLKMCYSLTGTTYEMAAQVREALSK